MTPPAALHASAVLAAALLAGLLSACQTTPAPGSEIRAQVHALPLTRQALERGATHGDLHAAGRAGATAADAAAGRVVLAGCALPEAGSDTGSPDRARLYTVTTVLPAAMPLQRGAKLRLKVEGDPFSGAPVDGRFAAVHGRFESLAPAGLPLDENTGVPWRLKPGDRPALQVRCRPLGGEPGRVQAAFFRSVRADEMQYAAAEAARHALFSDAELAAGRVARLRCRLRMADGAEWHVPEFLARVPDGLAVRPGDIVSLRAGVDEAARPGGPVGQVLARVEAAFAAARPGGVDCR